MASRFASATMEQILSINEAAVPKKMASKLGLTVFNGSCLTFPNSKFYARERATDSLWENVMAGLQCHAIKNKNRNIQ